MDTLVVGKAVDTIKLLSTLFKAETKEEILSLIRKICTTFRDIFIATLGVTLVSELTGISLVALLTAGLPFAAAVVLVLAVAKYFVIIRKEG